MTVANDRLGNLPERLGDVGLRYVDHRGSLPRVDGVPPRATLDPAAIRDILPSRPEHRFVDIGFGLPRLKRPGRG